MVRPVLRYNNQIISSVRNQPNMPPEPSYARYKALFQGKAMPFAFVDLDLLNANAASLIQRAASKPIRIASKSVRCVAVLQHIFSLSSAFRGIMSYSPTEALHLSKHGFDDLLIAYPCWNPAHIAAICAEIRAGKTILLMIDSVEHVAHLQAIAAREGVTLPVCLDVDLSMDLPGLRFGVWRSPVNDAKSALKVHAAIKQSPNLRLDGIMGYEAQIAGLGDTGAGVESMVVRQLKKRSIPQLRERRRAVVEALQADGATLKVVNGGGTGSLESTAQEDCVTEVTAGSGFYAPTLFDAYNNFQHLPAAGYAIEVVRKPAPNLYTCFSGGYIASGAVGTAKQPSPYLPVGAKLTGREGAGEVQTPISYRGSEKLTNGDPVFMRHAKAGELMEHFNNTYLVSGGEIIAEVPTYRGEGGVFA